MNFMSIVWLIAMFVLGAVEVATVTLTCIWFAIGALVAAIAALFGAELWLQILLFVAVSLVSILALRPLAQTKFGGKHKVATNADRLIGQNAIVQESIDNLAGTGAVSVGGIVWTARSEDNIPISEGSVVSIVRIDGVKLFVQSIQKHT